MAIRTSTQSGPANTGSTWVGGVAPADGDQIVINHSVTQDVARRYGTYPPQTPITIPTISLSAGGTVTSLPSGIYQFRYTFVDSNGQESHPTINIGSGSVVNGSSKPRVTFPSLPSGISSINLYLSAAGGAAGTETLYASGITGTTYDLVSASWTNGTTTQAAAAAWVSKFAIQINAGGTLLGSNSSVITAAADISIGNSSGTGILQGWADGVIEFDHSSAASEANTNYVLWFASTNNFGNNYAKLTTSGTSAGHYFEIRTKSGATKKARTAIGIGPFGSYSDAVWISSTSYVKLTRMGDSSKDSITFNNSTGGTAVVMGLDHWIFDTCGRVNWSVVAPAAGGFNISNCTWKNTPSGVTPLLLAASATLTTGTRSLTNCVFDLQPSLPSGAQATINGNYFDVAFVLNGVSTGLWASFDSNIIRTDFQTGSNSGGFPTCGDVTNCIIFGDTAPSAVVTGTVTSASSTTLVDSTKTWTLNQYAATTTGLTTGWTVVKQTAGVWECRNILSNTTSGSLTVNRAWDVTPTAGDTYKIYNALANAHFIASSTAANGTTVNLTGNIGQFIGSDNNGDFFLHLDGGSSGSHNIYNVKNNCILPSIARDGSGTLVTIGANPNGEFYIEHNTTFCGPQCLSVNEGVATSMTGVIKSYKSNLWWNEVGKTYALGGAGGGASTLGPFKAVDSSHLPISTGGGATDIILNTSGTSAADYNGSYGILSAYADQNFAGSGKGYQVKTSIAMGLHDVDDIDPNFVSRWRGIWDWAATFGATGDPFQQVTTLRTILKAANEPSDSNYNAGATPSAALTYLRAGQAPQALAYHNTAHDGGDIGAVAYISLTSPVNISKQLVWNNYQKINLTSIFLWNTLNTAGKADSLLWNTQAVIRKSDSLIWNSQQSVNSTKSLLYNINKAINKTETLLWNISANINKTNNLVWNTYKAINKNNSLLWNTYTTVNKNNSLIWNNFTLVTNKNVSLIWNDYSKALKSVQVNWNISQLVDKFSRVLWNILSTSSTVYSSKTYTMYINMEEDL